MSIEDVKLSESRIRSNVIYCHCPKCTGLCNDYIRAGTLREALDMAMDALQQLTEKDATIEALQNDLRDIKALIKAKWYETAEKRIDAALREGDKDE